MSNTGFENLTLLARTAYAIMCFERYTGFVYSDVNFRPAAEMMWRIVDGSEPAADAADRYREIIPENLFSFRSYAAYREAGHSILTLEQYRVFSHILNANDRNLNRMMKYIYQIPTEYRNAGAVKPGAPETVPYLEEMTSMLRVRSVAVPDLRLLSQHTSDGYAPQHFDWMGGPVDPAPLSQLGITGSAPVRSLAPADPATHAFDPAEPAVGAAPADPAAEPAAPAEPVRSMTPADPVTHNEDAGPNILMPPESGYGGYEQPPVTGKAEDEKGLFFFGDPARPSAEVNGCRWEFIETPEFCVLTQCINHSFLKEVTVPSELNGKPVTTVDDGAFSNSPEGGCMFIEKLIMPDTVRQIGDGFFRSCTGLRQITLPAELESIGNDAFRGASKLESITIGNNCRIIGDFFCADAVSLQFAVFGTGIEYVGQYTFYNTPAMSDFRCDGMIKELGYGSFWVNKWADKIIFNPATEMLRFCKGNALLYRYVKRTPPPRLFFDESIKYVYDFAFGGDAWNYGEGIWEIYFPGAEKIGVQVFRKAPNATVHLSASRMEAAYGQDYRYTLETLCKPARVVFDLP